MLSSAWFGFNRHFNIVVDNENPIIVANGLMSRDYWIATGETCEQAKPLIEETVIVGCD